MNDQAATLRRLMMGRNGEESLAPIITFTFCGEYAGMRGFLKALGGRLRQGSCDPLAVEFIPAAANRASAWMRDSLDSREYKDVILVTSYAGVELLPFEIYGPAIGNIVVVGDDDSSLDRASDLIRVLRRKASVSQLGVIVKDVTDGATGLEIYLKLKKALAHYKCAELEYLGHYDNAEKLFTDDPSLSGSFLIDLETEVMVSPEVELLAKRISTRYLKKSNRLTGHTEFKDEPVATAPGNTARFWKTLFGEVKA